MDLFKKPYEISLWDDRLYWVRRKLERVELSKETYKPGVYYCDQREYEYLYDSDKLILTDSNGVYLQVTTSNSIELSNESNVHFTNIAEALFYKIDLGPWVEDRIYYKLVPLTVENSYLEGKSLQDISISNENENNWRNENGFLVPQIITQFHKEIRICTLGSNTMESPARCINPKLVSKINGENTLTFSLYYRYWNDNIQDFDYNPFLKYLVNERKVKLRLGPTATDINDECCKWYDFVIKQVQENSDSKMFTYTCKDQFMTELSKTGFELVLDNELENNIGTIDELASEILKDSDWRVQPGDNLKQYIKEPLYEILVKDDVNIEAKNMVKEEDTINLAGKKIYAFYSIINSKNPNLQFLYKDEENFRTDDDRVILREYPNYLITNVTYTDKGIPTFAESMSSMISIKYRGERLVRQLQTKYDSTIDKYVQVYKDKEGEQYYGFTETEYLSPSAVSNYVANSDSFKNTSGWQTDKNQVEFDLATYPNFNPQDELAYKTFLHYTNNEKAWIMNAGISGNRSTIEQFVKGEKYIFRIKYKTAKDSESYETKAPSVKISFYEYDENKYFNFTRPIFTFGDFNGPSDTNAINAEEDFITLEAECVESISKTMLTEMNTKIGLFINFDSLVKEVYIENMQVFPYITYEDETNTPRICVPGGKLFSDIKTKYIYYKPNSEYKSIDDLAPATESYSPADGYEEVYNDNEFTKIRSITAKESNRFNLIQNLSEIFECWPRFIIKHNQQSGEILYGKDIENHEEGDEYRQQKFVTFQENMGNQYNWAGFRYGINSKSITRSLDSNSVVTKLIVKNNANEFAPNGFCSIARATENRAKENFLLNFDYYIHHKLLNDIEVYKDLYLENEGYVGYYPKLGRLNKDREERIEIQTGLLKDINNFTASYKTYKTSYDNAVEQEVVVRQNIKSLTGYSIEELYSESSEGEIEEIKARKESWRQDPNFIKEQVSLIQLKTTQITHKPLYETAKNNLDEAQASYDEIQQYLITLAEQKRALNLQFYKKYSRFIQEGSWIKEDYVDDNLYYLDAEGVLYTSSQPKVSYTINILDLSVLPGYENYKFELGERSYVEDIEFFGYSLIDSTTPYREEIIITELTQELDSPERNIIKVQNYKTQFEDLFQRIAATTQSVEYHSGEYAKAANIIQPNGLISFDTLQNSIANNALQLENIKDQSVVWNEYGITTTSLSSPNEIVRIVSGGIFMSNDGGETWRTGITGSGISASYLTAGRINTNEIYIMNDDQPSFRWDGLGLSAYEFGATNGFNNSKFVRFDQYGIYGIDGISEFDPNIEENGKVGEDKIWDNAKFALTWKGFSLKNNDGSVNITSTDDIQVFNGDQERIKIGRIEDDVYGIRISNAKGDSVMETDDKGELWLKNRLRIGTNDTSTVEIGYLEAARDGTSIHEVIHAGNSEQNFIVYEDGKMVAQGAEFHGAIEATSGSLGAIIIDSEGFIKTNDFDSSNTSGWCISSDKAIFNDIIARGTISTAVFEKGKIQTASGMILVRPSALIQTAVIDKDKNRISITTSPKDPGFNLNEYCEIGEKQNGENLYKIIEINKDVFILEPVSNQQILEENIVDNLIVGYGASGSIAIAINSSENQAFSPRAISINEVLFEEGEEITTRQIRKRAIFGDLQGAISDIKNINGYGIYADNVYLKGAMISSKKSGTETITSGINTESTTTISKGNFTNPGNIILWAGAKGEDIQSAPFQVDNNGNFYANSGYFEGSIFTKANIEAAEIKTAVITGKGENPAPALRITGASNAIVFEGSSQQYLELSSREMLLNISLKVQKDIEVEGSINFGTNKIVNSEDGLQFYYSKNSQMVIEENQVDIKNKLSCQGNVYYGGIMEYRKNGNGYDLYITG